MVGGRQVGAVVDGNGILAKSPGWLQTDKNIPQVQARDGQGVTGAVHLSRRVAPGFLQLLLHSRSKVLKPAAVLPAVDVAGGQPELLFRQRVPVVAAPLDDAVYQFIAVGGDVVHHVTGRLEGVKQVNHRCRRVQAHRIADTGILGGVVAHYDGDALFAVGL